MIWKVIKTLLAIGLLVLVGWILYTAATIILYILVALVVVLIARPLMIVLKRVRIRNRTINDSVAAGLSLFAVMGVLALIIGLFLPVIFKEVRLIGNIDLDSVQEKIAPYLTKVNEFVARFNLNQGNKIDQQDLMHYVAEWVDISHLPGVFNSVLGVFGNVVIAVFSIAFISFFFLRDQKRLNRLVLSVTPYRLEPDMMHIINNTRNTLTRYFLGLLIQIVAISTTVFIGLSIVGIENALLIACFTGIVNLIPYLGPWIGASFGVFIVIANNINASFTDVIQPQLIGMVIVFVVTQMIDNYVFQPTIFSKSVNAHPLEIFLVILVAGTIGGVGGMIAAIPVYAFLRIVFIEMDKEFEWMAGLKRR